MGTGPALGLLTTGGTPALGKLRPRAPNLHVANSIPRENAVIVQSLLDAGMIGTQSRYGTLLIIQFLAKPT